MTPGIDYLGGANYVDVIAEHPPAGYAARPAAKAAQLRWLRENTDPQFVIGTNTEDIDLSNNAKEY